MRGRLVGASASKRIETPARQNHTGHAAANGEDHALGEKLADEPGAAGAERGADGNFAVARGGAGEEKIREVRAGDEQDAADGAEQCVKHRLHIAHACNPASAS